jgi:pimeloyl-ACP methyl ester carboxylesterase
MFFTTKEVIASDLAAGIEYVAAQHNGERPVLIGHSAGGGLSQATLNLGLARVRAVGLIGAFPNYGGFWVYMNWFLKLDGWAFLRAWKDFMHPRSPWKTTQRVHNAFFSATFPTKEVQRFEKDMPEYESMMWPCGMMSRFVDVANVKASTVTGKVLIISGNSDRLMTPDLMETMAKEYGAPYVRVEGGHNVMRDQFWEESAREILKWIEGLEK